jgi:hypothetical protein
MSARTGGTKAAAPWAARMRGKRQPAAARTRPAAATARRQAQTDKHQGGNVMIRKLKSGEYRLYSRNKNPKTGKLRNLATFSSRQAAEKRERAVQFFKRGR